MDILQIDRTKIIGASDVPALLGIDPFCSPLMLWSIKTGEVEPKDISDNESVFWGNKLERQVSDVFAERHNVKLIAYKKRFIHKTMPYFSCELDNIIAGTDTIVEIKTVNAHAWKHWEKQDELPAKVIAQVMAQMGLAKRKDAWVFCLCGGQRSVEKYLKFDPEFYVMIEERVAQFWQMVLDKTPPMAMGLDNEFIVELYPKHGEQIQKIEEVNDKIGLLQQVKGSIADLETQKDELEAGIKQIIGDAAGVQTSEYLVTWKRQMQTRLDTEAIRAADLYDKYSVQNPIRVLRVRKNK